MLIVCGRSYAKAAAPVSEPSDPGAAQVAAGEHKPMTCRVRQHTHQIGNPRFRPACMFFWTWRTRAFLSGWEPGSAGGAWGPHIFGEVADS